MSGSWFFRDLFRRFDFNRVDYALTCAGRRQHWKINGNGCSDVFDAVGTDRQGAQTVLATDTHKPGEIHRAFVRSEFVQSQDQRRIAEEVGGLCHFRRQLPVERFKVGRASSITVMASMLPLS